MLIVIFLRISAVDRPVDPATEGRRPRESI